jgi:hypothetical protein
MCAPEKMLLKILARGHGDHGSTKSARGRRPSLSCLQEKVKDKNLFRSCHWLLLREQTG